MVAARLFLVVSACFGLINSLPNTDFSLENAQLVSRGSETLDYAAFCWDTTTWSNKSQRASLADILTVADEVEKQASCQLGKSRDNWKRRSEIAVTGSAKVNILWTEEKKNKDVFLVEYPCGRLAGRIRNIANSCASLLNTNYLMIWSILGICDGDVLERTPGVVLPISGQSGVAMDISASGIGLIPDMRELRRNKPFVRVNVTTQETEAPIPGFEAYPV